MAEICLKTSGVPSTFGGGGLVDDWGWNWGWAGRLLSIGRRADKGRRFDAENRVDVNVKRVD